MKFATATLRKLTVTNFDFTADGIKIVKKKVGSYSSLSLFNQYHCSTTALMKNTMELISLNKNEG